MTDVSVVETGVRRKRGRPPGSGGLNGHRKLPQVTRDTLDGRTRIAREFEAIVDGISTDLGGADRLSTIQRSLIEAYAGCACVLNDLNTRALRGEPFDLLAYATCVSTLIRTAGRLGVKRVPRDVTTIDEYIASKSKIVTEDAA
jgi:hypothetical protein